MDDLLKKGTILLAVLITWLGLTVIVSAADFPVKPVTLINPYAAGGSTDMIIRVLAETTKKHLGQPLIIDNKPGGQGTIGPATMAATAKPDGYTLCVTPSPLFRVPFMMKVSFDPLTDFTYVIHMSAYPMGVVVRKESPWQTFHEFITYAKANPGKIKYATTGPGSVGGLTMENISHQQNLKWKMIPMKGVSETTAAVLGGHVDASADSTGWGPQVDAGQLRLIAVWGNDDQRLRKWPSVPTLKELGYGSGISGPIGITGPKGMDPKIVKILHDALKKGMMDPAFQKAWINMTCRCSIKAVPIMPSMRKNYTVKGKRS